MKTINFLGAIAISGMFLCGKIVANPLITSDNTDKAVNEKPENRDFDFFGLIKDNKYIVDIEFSKVGTFYHNINQFKGVIDWGDGTSTEYKECINNPSHVYSNPGRYTVVAKGYCTQLDSNFGSKVIVDVKHIGSDMGITIMSNAFVGQRHLTSLRPGVFDGLKKVTTFSNAFLQWSNQDEFQPRVNEVSLFMRTNKGLKHIPKNLFDKCVNVIDFSACFMGCEIQEIPEGLFKNQRQLRNLAMTFCNTDIHRIPLNLLDNNQLVDNMRYTFFNCNKVTGMSPYVLFKDSLYDKNGKFVCYKMHKAHAYERDKFPIYFKNVIDHAYCFTGCTKLTDYENIPDNWKQGIQLTY